MGANGGGAAGSESASHRKKEKIEKLNWRERWTRFARVLVRFIKNINHFSSLIQAALLCATLIVAIHESYKVRQSLDTATWSTVSTQQAEIDKIFVDHPKILPYFTSGKIPHARGEDYDQAYAAATMMMDFLDNSTSLNDQVSTPLYESGPWDRYYRREFSKAPILCKVFYDDPTIYGQIITDKAKKYCNIFR